MDSDLRFDLLPDLDFVFLERDFDRLEREGIELLISNSKYISTQRWMFNQK
jgi:hypothetical protein